MDITVNEKIKLRDIFASLKDIFVGSKTDENEDILNQKIQHIFKVQSELGATKSIEALEKEVETHEIEEKNKKKSSRISTNKVISANEVEISNEIEIDNEKSLER